MKLIEAINIIDDIKPNNYSQSEKIKWIERLDGMVKIEILDTHEQEEEITFDGYTESDLQKDLFVGKPYEDIYIKWLESQIDYANNEYGKYNNSSAAFNEIYQSFSNYYNRSHMPIGKKIKVF